MLSTFVLAYELSNVCETYVGKPIGMHVVPQLTTEVAKPLTQYDDEASWKLRLRVPLKSLIFSSRASDISTHEKD
jgi:hypothetical protein